MKAASRIIGVGIDLFDAGRLKRTVQVEGEEFLRGIFSSAEVALGSGKRESWLFFARCFAAKEAVIKAIGSDKLKGFYWREIEILPREQGGRGFTVRCSGFVRRLIDSLSIRTIEVSVFDTADQRLVVAVAMAAA